MKKWKNNWNSPEYNAWIHMIHRCTNKNDKAFKHYGALGISVCDRWMNSFDNFVDDMGMRPSKDHSLDRIDVNGNYCKENCRWADKLTQANNKRKSKKIEVFGLLMTAREIANETGIPIKTIKSRIDKNMSPEKIISQTFHIRKDWEHGTIYGYIKMKCRCDQCKKAKSDHAKSSYQKNKIL